ncbi:MAG TPA: hypothetical protein VFV40_02620 [Nocardioides sp.]|nr:hypothetical protein [Nocardioides sp.]
MKKLLLLTGAAVGYVLGAKAGRERYDQIMATAKGVARDPRVQQKARVAQTAVKENAPVVKDKVAEAAGNAKAAAQDKLGSKEDTRTTAAAGAAYPGT